MTSLLSTDQIRDHVETDLPDEALQLRIDAAEAEIVQRFGPHAGEVSEIHQPGVGAWLVQPRREIDTGEDVTIVSMLADGSESTLVEDEDWVIDAPRQIRLLVQPWELLRVTYTPVADTPQRKAVLVDLVKLDLAFQGVMAESLGDVSVTHADHARERVRILRRLQRSVFA